VLLRLAYLTVANTFAVLRLLLMSDRDKDVEILALRHQIGVLERQLGDQRVRFASADRAFLAALVHRVPRQVRKRLRLLVRPRHGAALTGTATSSPVGTQPPADPKSRDGPAPCARSELWCCGWPPTTPDGGIGAYTGNCWSSG
jgi:hypothetical protein